MTKVMNSHGKKVWQAWLDGKTVQTKFDQESKSWRDADPSNCVLNMPHKSPHLWRIKPELTSRWYRVWLRGDSSYNQLECIPAIVTNELYEMSEMENKVESAENFVKWLTRWTEYELEIEPYIEYEEEEK